jgi:hypothetical protein
VWRDLVAASATTTIATATAIATTTTSAAATVATTSAAATEATTASAATATILFRTSLVYSQSSSTNFMTIESSYSRLCFSIGAHLYKAKSLRAAGISIRDDFG